MYRIAKSIPLASIAAGGMVFCLATSVDAGQFKTLNTEGLGVGGSVVATSGPKNTGQAMEMEVFEFRTAVVNANYTCSILANTTGRTLNIRLIGVNGLSMVSCSAPPGRTCSTAPQSLFANLKFHCLVATTNNAPVLGTDATYRMSVNRVAGSSFAPPGATSEADLRAAGVAPGTPNPN